MKTRNSPLSRFIKSIVASEIVT